MVLMTVFALFKFIAVAIIMVAMVMILLSIGHLSHPDDIASAKQTKDLLRQLEKENKVIGEESVFNKFLGRNGSYKFRR